MCLHQLTDRGSSASLSSCLGTSSRSMKLCSSFLKAFIWALIRYRSSCSLILWSRSRVCLDLFTVDTVTVHLKIKSKNTYFSLWLLMEFIILFFILCFCSFQRNKPSSSIISQTRQTSIWLISSKLGNSHKTIYMDKSTRGKTFFKKKLFRFGVNCPF